MNYNFVVTAYFTIGTLYEIEARRLISSLAKFEIPYHVVPIENRGDWYLNTQFKPTFLKEMLKKFNSSLVYVDVDAEFCQPPILFDELNARPDVNIGVHLLDHAKRGRQAAHEMLSGTIFLKNNLVVHDLVNRWVVACSKGGQLWDQAALREVIGSMPFYVLPEEYCTIFDYMSDVKNPVIKHYQASRKVPNKLGNIPLPTYDQPAQPISKKQSPEINCQPIKVPKGGISRYHRKWRNIV